MAKKADLKALKKEVKTRKAKVAKQEGKLKAAKKAQSETNKKLKILAVTILTSLANKDLKQML